MKLKDARQNYYDFSGIMSEVNRKLAFAGIAVVWIFAITEKSAGTVRLPDVFYVPLGMFVLCLAFDLAHYVVASASWGVFHRVKERCGVSEEDDFLAPKYINWAPLFLYWGKVLVNFAGFILLLRALLVQAS